MSSIAAETAGLEPPTPSSAARPRPSISRLLKPVASLQLTVILLALSIVLVFVGTIAQVDDSIHIVLNRYFYTWIAWVPFDVLVRFGQKFAGVAQDTHIAGSFPFPGGWLLGCALMLNLLSAHAMRFKINWRRSGIWLIHIGIVILLLGEFLSSQLKIESQMRIETGGNSNFADDTQFLELAIIDSSDPKDDQVFTVPEELLRRVGRISDPKLPVDLEVVRFIPASTLTEASPRDNPATEGFGKRIAALARKPVSGVSPEQQPDIASAYIHFFDRGTAKDLGTFLLTRWYELLDGFDKPTQTLTTDSGKKYSIVVRARRYYLPYSLHLNEFRFDRFIGTGIARNYSSDVRLVDPEQQVDRQARIKMNEPLRYRGRTFYQADFDHATESATILTVVRNPAWTAPYVACSLVVVGLLVHFGIHLSKFAQRRGKT